MTESQISCFEAAAKFRNFSKAAKYLMISQPAISHQISKLEQELDLLLFDRTGRVIRLTEAGSMLLDFFMRTKGEFSDLLKEAHARQDAFSGEVLLGCPEGWDISPFLPSMVNFFRSEYPKVHVELVGLPLGEIEDALLEGRIHAGVTMEYALEKQTQLSTHPLISVRSVLLYSGQFPIGHEGAVTLADFKDSVFYLAAANNTPLFREIVVQACAEYHFTPKIVNCPSLSTALFNVQNNQGVLLGNELMMANHLDHLYSYLTLDDIRRSIVLAWKPEDAASKSPLHLFLNETLYGRNILGKLSE